MNYSSYSDDVSFMRDYIDIIELSDRSGKAKIAISAALQGRIMTSSSSGPAGRSYGWINKELLASGETMEHINAFGGEERFWLGPEGGQFSIFFKKGDAFNLETWQTPSLIDTESFEVKSVSPDKATFTKTASLVNYSGFKFDIGIDREIAILSIAEAFDGLGFDPMKNVKVVAYRTNNTLTNLGSSDWEPETGLLSIWLLGMFNPSPETTVVIPYVKGDGELLGKRVNDDYFGKVPDERLIVDEEIIYFKADGLHRGKIGISPTRAKNILGSYDASSRTLTIIKYNKPEHNTSYVNSLWEIQEDPFAGDVINSYNDGPAIPGSKPLGPFYELETSSPALALKAGSSSTHEQITWHFEGDVDKLSQISKKILGVSVTEISNVFK
ncbi:MAG TPA: DUF6786 family protein [Arenibacter sp.]|nr:DUF6786 family protein [Arenibacter sp.]